MSKELGEGLESEQVSAGGLIDNKIGNFTSTKNNDAAIPLHLWLKWLKSGLRRKLTIEIFIQEKLLLLRWRLNVTSSF